MTSLRNGLTRGLIGSISAALMADQVNDGEGNDDVALKAASRKASGE